MLRTKTVQIDDRESLKIYKVKDTFSSALDKLQMSVVNHF